MLAGGTNVEPNAASTPPAHAGGSALSGHQALFGIIQGAGHLEHRKESLERTVEIGFDGYAIGGLSVGEEKPVMYEVLDFLAPQMTYDHLANMTDPARVLIPDVLRLESRAAIA